MPRYNEAWAGKVLGMNVSNSPGPDLIDGEKAVEIKFKLTYDNKYYDKCWRVLGHQLDYDKDYSEIYWGFGFYSLDREINKIKRKDLTKLDSYVTNRQIYLVNWNWAKSFPKYLQSGETELSKWRHFVSYPRMNKSFPEIIHSEDVFGGEVFFTEGVNPERFELGKILDDSFNGSCRF